MLRPWVRRAERGRATAGAGRGTEPLHDRVFSQVAGDTHAGRGPARAAFPAGVRRAVPQDLVTRLRPGPGWCTPDRCRPRDRHRAAADQWLGRLGGVRSGPGAPARAGTRPRDDDQGPSGWRRTTLEPRPLSRTRSLAGPVPTISAPPAPARSPEASTAWTVADSGTATPSGRRSCRAGCCRCAWRRPPRLEDRPALVLGQHGFQVAVAQRRRHQLDSLLRPRAAAARSGRASPVHPVRNIAHHWIGPAGIWPPRPSPYSGWQAPLGIGVARGNWGAGAAPGSGPAEQPLASPVVSAMAARPAARRAGG